MRFLGIHSLIAYTFLQPPTTYASMQATTPDILRTHTEGGARFGRVEGNPRIIPVGEAIPM
ncbi:unnamed protein product [Penicillium camemberti]|uniref:Str. FM013 n=1 Tax=Penicillium camemberti (strain FM 013) TaxID=1429867 RepID=A0A0G4PXP3_PENC3|nr:unnamed protein product [Penicillium camemberti]